MGQQAESGRRGVALAIAAPSGAGKSTVCRHVLAAEPGTVLSVSLTTRPPRPGERDGVDYRFVDDASFRAQMEAGELLEWATVFGRSYGTPAAPIRRWLAEGRDVLLDIDWQGWRSVRERLGDDAVGVFILPPSLETLAVRLRSRAQDSGAEVARRMAGARAEIAHWAEFDHALINDDLERCVDGVLSVLRAARSRVPRQIGLGAFVDGLLASG